MSVQLHGFIRRHPRTGGTRNGESWMALVVTTSDDTEYRPDVYEVTFEGSQPEALQSAYKMLSDLDRQLSDEVHESRSSRHARRAVKLAAESSPSPVAACGDDPYQHITTTEPTA